VIPDTFAVRNTSAMASCDEARKSFLEFSDPG
jgi:hypothetical protein